MGRVDEALPGLERAAQFNPSDPTRHVNLGSELATAGRLQEAIVEYQKAIEVASGISVYSGFKDVASIYDELGDYPGVRESYREALKMDPAATPAMIQRMSASATEDPSGASYLQLGILFEEAGQLQEARAAYGQALRVEPSFDSAKLALEALDQHK
jgi:tetratricopeptide (TPR) repeat protein